jgi:AAA ATPase domain
MHLKAFEVRNYRAFVEPARVELRPLTLLFGYNNAGKSALARVLPLLRDSVGGEAGLPLNLDSEAVRGAEFADLRSKQTGRRTIELGLEWSDEPSLERARLVLQDLPELRRHVVESFEIAPARGRNFEGKLEPSSDGNEGVGNYALSREGELVRNAAVKWQGLIPKMDQLETGLGEEKFFLKTFADGMSSLSRTLWLGSVRTSQPRFNRLPRVRPKSIDWNGVGAAEVRLGLVHHARQNVSDGLAPRRCLLTHCRYPSGGSQ